MRSVIISLILILAIGSVSIGADVIRVDPNASPANPKPEPEQQVDIRLAQKITYVAEKKTVSTIISELSEMTGITLNAGYNKQDWQVRDRRMNIFANDVTLAHLMNSIARVMKFKWSVSDDSKAPSYRLYMDRQTLLNAESQKAREEERYKQQQAEKRRSTIEQFGELDNLSPEELAKLRDENPFLYLAKTTGVSDSLASFFKEVPMAVDALSSGQEMVMSASRMTPAAQQGVLNAIRSLNKIENTIERRDNTLPDDLAQNIGRVTVSMNQGLAMMEGRPEAGMLLGDITMAYNGRTYGVPILDPNSKMARLIGKMVVKSLEENRPMNEVGKGMEVEIIAAMISDRKQSSFGEPPIEHGDDPALDKKVKLKNPGMGRNLSDIQAQLVEASGMTIVSDCFGRIYGFSSITAEETEIRKILDNIADTYNYNWDKKENIIELRDREWFRKRAAQLPEAWLEKWRQSLKKTGTLPLDEITQIAALTLEQFNTNISGDEVLGKANLQNAFYVARDIIRFYSSLDQQQKQMVFSETGLNSRMLSPAQWSQLEKLILKRNGAILEDPDAVISISGTMDKDQYNFILTSSVPDTRPVTWALQAPKYEEPKEDVKKDAPIEKPATE